MILYVILIVILIVLAFIAFKFVVKINNSNSEDFQEELDDYNKRHESTLNKVKRSILSYLEWEKINLSTLMITDVEINIGFKDSDDDVIQIYITSGRPGLLIGKGGRSFKELKSHIELDLERKVEIEIVECKLWKNIYSI